MSGGVFASAARRVRLFIDGEETRAASGKTFANINPATGKTLAQVCEAGAEDVDRAVAAAERGFDVWRAKSGAERGRVLSRACELLRQHNDELARLETLDTGKPIREALADDINMAADCLEYYAGLAAALGGEHLQTPGGFSYTRREPLGVCAGIGAWNYPLQVAAWKAAPALACGNAMVYKPAEQTPTTANCLALVLREAGLPAGVFNVTHGFAATGEALSRHPKVAKVSLTGEAATGRRVMADAAATLKTVTMELGGKSPLLVFDDANLQNAVAAAMLGNFYTQGEICTNCTRVFLHRAIKDAFVERLLAEVKKLRVGDPLSAKTHIGSLISREHQQKVLQYIQRGVDGGARLLAGGGAPQAAELAAGAFVLPTVFDDCRDDMPIVTDEIFGPVMSLLVFDDEEEAIARANNTPYGLAAGVFTQNLARAHRVVARLQAGICWINTYNQYHIQLPAGGFKQSGIGTENGQDTLRQYTQIKTVTVELGDLPPPFGD